MKQKLLTLLLACFVCISNYVYAFQIDGIYYSISGDNVVVIKSKTKYSGDVVIPESVTYDGTTYSVISIDDEAFSSCEDLTSVTIPNSVTSIGQSAFSGCSSLTSITIPNSVSLIKGCAFSDCTGLTSVNIGNSVSLIGFKAFMDCSSLTSVNIPNSVTIIDHSAFMDCSGLNSLVIGDSVTSIGQSAFSGCSGLTSITIPNSVNEIGSGSFAGCESLTSLTIPNSVTEIGEKAFNNTALLNNDSPYWENNVLYIDNHLIKAKENLSGEYTIKEGTLTIAGSAFEGCIWLTSVTIPNSVVSIGKSAFYGSRITSITIPDSVTSIGSNAFRSCPCLTSITIPDSVTSIGMYAFEGLPNDSPYWENDVLYIGNHLIKAKSNLSGEYTIKDGTLTIADYAFEACYYLTSINIPNSVTSIGAFAFSNCRSLASATIPDSVTSIGMYAFDDTELSYYTSSNWENGLLYIGNHLIQAKTNSSSEYTIKDGTLTIAARAFMYTKAPSVTIPNSVISICKEAFYGCHLSSLTVDNPNPANIALENCVFSYAPIDTCILYVSEGSEHLYASADQWKEFVHIKDINLCFVEIHNKDYSIPNDLYYDLAGRRVVNPTHGIYIKNGKKVLFR